MKLLLIVLLALPAFAETLEERVTRLEADVAALKATGVVGLKGYYQSGRETYTVAGTCEGIRARGKYYVHDFAFDIIKRVQCGEQKFVIGSHLVPAGYQGAGQLKVDAFLEKDVILP